MPKLGLVQARPWVHTALKFKNGGEVFLLTVGAFLLTVKLLCLQSLKALIKHTFPLSKKTPTVSKKIVSKEAPTVSKKKLTLSTASKKAPL